MNNKIVIFVVAVVIAFALGFWSARRVYTAPHCPDGASPDANGCCAGEVYTDMGDKGFNCCPEFGDCFEPIK